MSYMKRRKKRPIYKRPRIEPQRTRMMNFRVSNEFYERFSGACFEFGMTVSEMLEFGAILGMLRHYTALQKSLFSSAMKLKQGDPKREAIAEAMRKVNVEREYYGRLGADPKIQHLYREIESLESYRDFLSAAIRPDMAEVSK